MSLLPAFAGAPYEIEFRVRFESDPEAFALLPFLERSFVRSVAWTDTYYGLDVFRKGQVLRLSSVSDGQTTGYFLGWKGPDGGTFANVRQELTEEIVGKLSDSSILAAFIGENGSYELQEIEPALERAGYRRFMAYEGHSHTGRYEPLGLSTKLMRCAALRWPLLVELEKVAAGKAEAFRCERELRDVCRRYELEERVVREEPGTLLYESIFGSTPGFPHTV